MNPLKRANEMSQIERASYIDQSVLKPEFSEGIMNKLVSKLQLKLKKSAIRVISSHTTLKDTHQTRACGEFTDKTGKTVIKPLLSFA